MPSHQGRLKIQGLEKLTKRDVAVLKAKANEALEQERADERDRVKSAERRQEHIATAKHRRETIDPHTRMRDAIDKTAQMVAQRSGISHTDARRFVAQQMGKRG